MAVRVAINGFGRIGRNVLRAIAESGRKDIHVVTINDLGPVETNAHLLRLEIQNQPKRGGVESRPIRLHFLANQFPGDPTADETPSSLTCGVSRHLPDARRRARPG